MIEVSSIKIIAKVFSFLNIKPAMSIKSIATPVEICEYCCMRFFIVSMIGSSAQYTNKNGGSSFYSCFGNLFVILEKPLNADICQRMLDDLLEHSVGDRCYVRT